MDENILARRVLLKTSPIYAKRFTDAVWNKMNSDMCKHPAFYRDVILSAPPEYHTLLNQVLDVHLSNSETAEARAIINQLNGKELVYWLDAYLGSVGGLESDYMIGIDTLFNAGLLGEP